MTQAKEYAHIAEEVKAAQAGDAAAMERIITEVQDRVYYTCLRILNNSSAAEDAAQDILFRIYRKVNMLKDPSTYIAWVQSITANECKNRLVRMKREVLFGEDGDGKDPFAQMEDLDTRTVPDKSFDRAETARAVVALINELPDEQRMCVVLYYYNQMKTREIASALGVSEGTVKNRLNYARKALREGVKAYEKDGVRLHGLFGLPILGRLLRNLRSVSVAASISAIASSAASAGQALLPIAYGKLAAGLLATLIIGSVGLTLRGGKQTAAPVETPQTVVICEVGRDEPEVKRTVEHAPRFDETAKPAERKRVSEPEREPQIDAAATAPTPEPQPVQNTDRAPRPTDSTGREAQDPTEEPVVPEEAVWSEWSTEKPPEGVEIRTRTLYRWREIRKDKGEGDGFAVCASASVTASEWSEWSDEAPDRDSADGVKIEIETCVLYSFR